MKLFMRWLHRHYKWLAGFGPVKLMAPIPPEVEKALKILADHDAGAKHE
jgi:hypothetical protein